MEARQGHKNAFQNNKMVCFARFFNNFKFYFDRRIEKNRCHFHTSCNNINRTSLFSLFVADQGCKPRRNPMDQTNVGIQVLICRGDSFFVCGSSRTQTNFCSHNVLTKSTASFKEKTHIFTQKAQNWTFFAIFVLKFVFFLQ